jgi:hypothetical protein
MAAITPLFETVQDEDGGAYAPAQFVAVPSRGMLIARAEPEEALRTPRQTLTAMKRPGRLKRPGR